MGEAGGDTLYVAEKCVVACCCASLGAQALSPPSADALRTVTEGAAVLLPFREQYTHRLVTVDLSFRHFWRLGSGSLVLPLITCEARQEDETETTATKKLPLARGLCFH